jgi:hypothetical protein
LQTVGKRIEPSNLVLKTFKTTPTTHDEWIIGGHHGDDIDAFGFEFFVLLEVWRQVVRVAGRLVGRGEHKPGC